MSHGKPCTAAIDDPLFKERHVNVTSGERTPHLDEPMPASWTGGCQSLADGWRLRRYTLTTEFLRGSPSPSDLVVAMEAAGYLVEEATVTVSPGHQPECSMFHGFIGVGPAIISTTATFRMLEVVKE